MEGPPPTVHGAPCFEGATLKAPSLGAIRLTGRGRPIGPLFIMPSCTVVSGRPGRDRSQVGRDRTVSTPLLRAFPAL